MIILTVTEKGLGKRSKIEDYPVQNSRSKGVISIKSPKRREGHRPYPGKRRGRSRHDNQFRETIRTLGGNISLHGRNTQELKLIDVEGDDKIVSVGRVAERIDVYVNSNSPHIVYPKYVWSAQTGLSNERTKNRALQFPYTLGGPVIFHPFVRLFL